MDLKRCLSGCPILEDLLTIDIRKATEGGFETALSNLVRATISPFDITFKAIYNVEFLRIIKMDEIDHNKNINAYYKDFPVFCNLIHLEILFSDYDHSWNNVAKVLQHSPKLQILLIRKRSSNYYTYRKDWESPNSIPECVSSHLKTCTIINYEGWKGDIQFSRYILKNARFLQVMRVMVSRIASYRKSQILEE
ncbi:putative FBD domain-containing protein [Medicago truncatula]|uniref:F-box/RNI/FBD-like domain protein n=1 Tax=Medicago truncatula TaxID=3880 RepID=G7JZC6_MEDTR|nr:F-box/RNI/FBD-like domain protein [Medicago truncatula]RHN55840.1 putative FBD domain-containing protein [Medicago truncatula]